MPNRIPSQVPAAVADLQTNGTELRRASVVAQEKDHNVRDRDVSHNNNTDRVQTLRGGNGLY